jgi:hypothetical protein
MKIVWRNPNKTTPGKVFIIRTSRLEVDGQVQQFYRCSSGPSIIGIEFELRVNRPRAA